MKQTINYYSPKQGRFPVFISESIKISDPVMTFDYIMEEIEIEKYLKKTTYRVGRKGYISLRELEDECKVNIRYMYLMEYETPTYKTFGNLINENLTDSAEDIFKEIMKYIGRKDKVDLNHLYIDGSKFEADANKYTWVWMKASLFTEEEAERRQCNVIMKNLRCIGTNSVNTSKSFLFVENTETAIPRQIIQQRL